MRQSEMLELIHRNSYPAASKTVPVGLFAAFLNDDGVPDIQVATDAMVQAISELPRAHRQGVMIVLGRLLQTFTNSMVEDKRYIESLMQAADEAEMHHRESL